MSPPTLKAGGRYRRRSTAGWIRLGYALRLMTQAIASFVLADIFGSKGGAVDKV
jgi:hypothetical protein